MILKGSVGEGGKNRPDDVELVQTLLKKVGAYNAKVDSEYGPQTQAAILAFQKTIDRALLQQWDLLTVPQVAAAFQVTPQTIRNWIDHGTLPAVRIGRAFRVKRQDVEGLLERASADSTSLATRRDL